MDAMSDEYSARLKALLKRTRDELDKAIDQQPRPGEINRLVDLIDEVDRILNSTAPSTKD